MGAGSDIRSLLFEAEQLSQAVHGQIVPQAEEMYSLADSHRRYLLSVDDKSR